MKRIIVTFLMSVILFSLTACSKNEKPDVPILPDKTDAPTFPEKTDVPILPEKTDAEQMDDTNSFEEQKVVQLTVLSGDHSFQEWGEEDYLYEVTWQSLLLGEEDSAKYPNLSTALKEMNEKNEKESEKTRDELAFAANELQTENGFSARCFSYSKYYIQRADDRILSFLDDRTLHSGGAHPMYWCNGVNINPATGESVSLNEILTDTNNLSFLIEQKIKEKYKEETFDGLKEYLDTLSADDFTWTIGYQGITFYFSPGEIASYAFGSASVTIWFEEAIELFEKEYITAPEFGYAVALPEGYEIEFDLDSMDGGKDTICIGTVWDEYQSYKMLTVQLNGKSYSDTVNYAYAYTNYLVHTGQAGKAKNFLYSDSITDNDYHMFAVYDLNGENVYLSDQLYGTGFSGVWYEEIGEYGTYYEEVFLDPSEFQLTSRLETLGTMSGRKVYNMDLETGMPIGQTTYYEIDAQPELISKIPVDVEILPDKTWEEIPEGKHFAFLRTDNETYVDMKLEDGRECRVTVEMSTWPRTVNGIAEEDCFEGILYAG